MILGIDPGVAGGIAVLHTDGSIALLRPFRPTMTETEFVAVVQEGLRKVDDEVFIEKVQYIGKRNDGRKGDGGQGAFTFGAVYGLIRGVVLAKGVVPRYVSPMMWQAALECMTGGVKNISKARARELWPAEKWTHAIADAALIAEYGRRATLRESSNLESL